jgi:branched-chain amino acid transport system ATP-binding protein
MTDNLKVEDITAFYGSSQALFGMSIDIHAGECVTLLGRNGMGKTTTIHAIMGIVPVKSGSIRFNERDMTGQPSFRIAQAGLGLVPEGRQIFPNLSVRENLVATATNRRKTAHAWTLERIFSMFPALSERRNSMANLLSGGEQQMLAIGRALMTNPQLLILDEATEGLAPLIRQDIWDCLAAIKKEGLSILIVDKNIADLSRLADRHFIIEKGKVVWSGKTAALKNDTELLNRYLGV